MKKIYIANWKGIGTKDDPRKPDLGTTEEVSYSAVDLYDGTRLVKVSASPGTIHGKIKAIEKTDDEALEVLRNTEITVEVTDELKAYLKNILDIDANIGDKITFKPYKNNNLSNFDIPDSDVDRELERLGYNPHEIRKNGGNNLKEQEYSAMEKIAIHKGKDISDLKSSIQSGRCDEHSNALKRLECTTESV